MRGTSGPFPLPFASLSGSVPLLALLLPRSPGVSTHLTDRHQMLPCALSRPLASLSHFSKVSLLQTSSGWTFP